MKLAYFIFSNVSLRHEHSSKKPGEDIYYEIYHINRGSSLMFAFPFTPNLLPQSVSVVVKSAIWSLFTICLRIARNESANRLKCVIQKNVVDIYNVSCIVFALKRVQNSWSSHHGLLTAHWAWLNGIEMWPPINNASGIFK